MDTNFYNNYSKSLSDSYDSLDPKAVHADWINELPDSGFALDIGAGSGRDARYMADHGLHVVAVEPAREFMELAKANSDGYDIHWMCDSLPELKQVLALNTKFDLILLSAVWMHIPASDRQRCVRKLASLLKPGGKIIITLRHGSCSDRRTMYEVSSDELSGFAKQQGLAFKLIVDQQQADQLGRNEVWWETVVLTLPDDGTGSFSLIRNIVINDSKSSTYKLALLRTILRIAEGHPGAVMDQDDDVVCLPMGLVAFYWYKLYKPLIDTYGMQQSSNANQGLGFVKDDGWNSLTHSSHLDLAIGALYLNPTDINAIHQCLKHISKTIKDMPTRYITVPNSDQRVFEAELKRNKAPLDSLLLDINYFASFGSFQVPRTLWYNFSNYSVWIEPALVNEWVNLMAGYQNNKKASFAKGDYLEALNWQPPVKNTQLVRNRVEEMMTDQSLDCVWSGSRLKPASYAIDHAFPFARWSNNDLWNLLPSTAKINNNKSDRLPAHQQMMISKDRILDWWTNGWQDNQDEFFIQANMALPGLNHQNRNFTDVFEAMLLQPDRIREIQQLQEWQFK